MHQVGTDNARCTGLSFDWVHQNRLSLQPRIFYELVDDLKSMPTGVEQNLMVCFLPRYA